MHDIDEMSEPLFLYLFSFVSNSQACILSINMEPGQLKNTVVTAGLDESEAFFKHVLLLQLLHPFLFFPPLFPPRALSFFLVLLSLPSPPNCPFLFTYSKHISTSIITLFLYLLLLINVSLVLSLSKSFTAFLSPHSPSTPS